MKNEAAQLEILLMTGTTFSSRQYCAKENPEMNKPLSEIEKLEEACWNGLVHEMLPEIYGQYINSKLFIWKISGASSFLNLEMGEFPKEINKLFSIDPYSFLVLQSGN